MDCSWIGSSEIVAIRECEGSCQCTGQKKHGMGECEGLWRGMAMQKRLEVAMDIRVKLEKDILMKVTMGPKLGKEEKLKLEHSQLEPESNGHPSLQRTFSAVISQGAGVVPAIEPILSVDWIEWNRVNGNGNEQTSA
ncbi:hypothetical protein FB451DRAFT_1187871 [Mycena latifolia]|nr:hypothetical protein FB451DRAFT_1187871 [Mycena latifolia]